jgi:tetratricopeptide (TPR) repeat protein
MTGANATPSLGPCRWLVIGLILTLLTVGCWLSWMKWTAQTDLARGKAALELDDPATARLHLDQCLAIWPRNAEAHFRAGQAARRCGDLAAATAHFDEAAKHGWDEEEVDLERALVQAQSGDLRSVEDSLIRWVIEERPGSHHVLAVLVPAFMAEFRWPESNTLAAKWTQLQPRSAAAWRCRAEVSERLRKRNDAVNALREAVELDPRDRQSRLNLARMLLETRQAVDEAAAHLAWLSQGDSQDPAVLVQLAVCREMQGSPDQAEALLDQVIAGQKTEPKAYYYRGRLELNRGRAAAAAPFLRRAAELDPGDLETLYSLFLCLRQAGTPAEARAAEDRWKRADADLKRVAELSRAVAASPHDPELRREMGELFLRNGRDRDGVRWLESALRERPDHEPSRRLLAEYYDRTGQPGLAAYHRAFLRPAPDREK